MKFKSAIRCVCAGLLVGACAMANALTQQPDLGVLSKQLNSEQVNFTSGFDDLFTFTAASSGAFGGLVGESSVAGFSGTYHFGIDTYVTDEAALKWGNFGIVDRPSGIFSLAATFSDLQAGQTYWLHLDGSNAGAGNYSVLLAPVPEPEVIAMLVAGLVLVGTIVRRRSSNSKLPVGA